MTASGEEHGSTGLMLPAILVLQLVAAGCSGPPKVATEQVAMVNRACAEEMRLLPNTMEFVTCATSLSQSLADAGADLSAR